MGTQRQLRPDPDDLLRQIEEREGREARGRLKIFLGYAPRVGKTIRMFEEGLRRWRRGQDVVVGSVQRQATDEHPDLLRDLEVVPVITNDTFEALDVNAILRRRPRVCLVDELAKDNPPGSRFQHRWQDVEELRASGINVVAAMNLQHVAEQQDAVERITYRRAANAIPQQFIFSADEITLVDVPAEQLAGDERGPGCLTSSQLSQLRELALLLAAQVVEEQLKRYMDAHGIVQSWGTQERMLICITPRSSVRPMLETGAVITKRFHGQMLAVYAEQGELPREAQETLDQNFAYARKLGAEVHVLREPDPVGAILDFARSQRITQIFIGHTRQKRWRFWAPSAVDRVLREAESMDVRVFPHPQEA